MKLDTHTEEMDGYEIRIDIHHDEDMGPPWEEHDGHGVVTDWQHRDEEPGELELCCDHGARRFYDLNETMKLAKRDGWGLSDEEKAKLAAKLGRKPTAKEIRVEAVRRDYEYLRAWCNDEWSWAGYITKIETPDGQIISGGSCWGFDDQEYMLSEALDEAKGEIERHKLTVRETAIAECCP